MIASVTGLFGADTAHFATNPILLTVSITDVKRAHMAGVRVDIIRSGIVEFTTEYTQPVIATSGQAVERLFDLSSAADTVFSAPNILDVHPDGLRRLSDHSLRATVFERYIDTTGAAVENVSADVKTTRLIPGGLSETELLARRDVSAVASDHIASALIGNIGWLSRKPDKEIVSRGAVYVAPFAVGRDYTLKANTAFGALSSAGISADYQAGKHSAHCLQVTFSDNHVTADIPALCTVNLVSQESIDKNILARELIITEPALREFHFIFLNGFGVPESFTCVASEAASYAIETSEYVSYHSRSQTGTARGMAQKSAPLRSYKLSSGVLSPEWAEWFATEFLTTAQALMLHPDTGSWIPVVIVPEDENTVTDRTSTGVTSFEFEARCAVSGSNMKASFLRN